MGFFLVSSVVVFAAAITKHIYITVKNEKKAWPKNITFIECYVYAFLELWQLLNFFFVFSDPIIFMCEFHHAINCAYVFFPLMLHVVV